MDNKEAVKILRENCCYSAAEYEEALDKAIASLEACESAYDKGYIDGLNQISKDLKDVMEIVFSNKYPEYKEDELIELLKPYRKESF